MRSRPKHLSFITATLLVSLTSPLLAVTSNFEPLIAQAQTAQNRKAEAEQLIQEANSRFSQAEYELTQEANSQLIERQYQKALESLQKALAIYQELAVSEASLLAKRQEVQEVRRRQRDILFMIGVIYGKLGQYEQVLKYSQQVLALDQEVGDRCQEQETLFRISSVYGVLGQYEKVQEDLEKLLAINRKLDVSCKNSYSLLLNTRDVYKRLGQPEKALKILEQLLAFDRKVSDRIEEQYTLLNISEIYEQQKQYEKALHFYQQALAISRELAVSEAAPQEGLSPVREPYILTKIGSIYEQQGNYEQALYYYQQALTINRKSNGSGVETLTTLSRAYLRLGQYEQALDSYQQALAANRLASSMYDQGQQYVISLSRQYIYMSLSQVYRELERDDRALESYQQALAIGKKHGNLNPLMQALNDWGAVQVKRGHFQEALETFEKALAISRQVAQNSRNSCGSAQPKIPNLGVARVYALKLGARSKCESFMGRSSLEGAETLILKNLGFVYRKLGQPEKSREFYEQALKRYQQKFAKLKEGNEDCWLQDELIRISREIAQVYEILGEDNLAREFYRQAEKLEFIQDANDVSCGVLGEVGSGIVLTDDDDSSTPRQSK